MKAEARRPFASTFWLHCASNKAFKRHPDNSLPAARDDTTKNWHAQRFGHVWDLQWVAGSRQAVDALHIE